RAARPGGRDERRYLVTGAVDQRRYLVAGVAGALAAYLLLQVFEPTDPSLAGAFWLLAGLLVSPALQSEAKPTVPSPTSETFANAIAGGAGARDGRLANAPSGQSALRRPGAPAGGPVRRRPNPPRRRGRGADAPPRPLSLLPATAGR